MSLSFNSDSVVGGPITSGSITQLEQRKNILQRKSGRSTDDFLFLTSNTGWVKMTSSVDTLTESQQEFQQRRLRSLENLRPKSSNQNAQSNVLAGGTLKNNKLTAGIFNTVDTAYSKSDIHGYRPDAGITSFQVDTKSMFGALRVATVEFKVNSIEQLDTLEALFLRPGFSILLEWGHTVYVDNKGTLVKNPKTYSDFFTPASDSQEIIKNIQTKKQESSYNYDAMFGIVKNFVWSYNLDGGYDCKVDLVSQGELIESLSVVISPERNTEESKENSSNTSNEGKIDEAEEKEIRTPLHEFLNSVNFTFERNSYDPEIRRISAISNLKFYVPKLTERVFNKLGGEDNFKVIYWQYSQSQSDQERKPVSSYALIPIQHLLVLVNEIFLLKSKTDLQENNGEYITKFFTGEKTEQDKFRKNVTPFVTFDYHFALDPTKVILPKGNLTKNSTKLGYLPENNTLTLGLVKEDILNIFVSTDLILDTLDTVINSNEPSKQTVLVFMKSLLREINKQLGQINDLDIGYDESENLHYIVDRKITPDNGNNLVTIDLVGIKSQVENLTFSSKLSNNVTSMMAIAAQSQNSDIGVDLLAVQKWNQGLIDRHLLTKFIGSETIQDKIKRENRTIPFVKEEDLIRLLKYLYEVNSINNDLVIATSELNDRVESASSLIPSHRAVMVGLLEYYTKKVRTNPSGLIPFELSLTLRGISGLKVGQAFKIPDKLIPQRYRGNVGFIITGVSHKIQSNRWVTDLQTQMCIISPYSNTVVEEVNLELPTPEEVRKSGNLSTNSQPDGPPTGVELLQIFSPTLRMKTRIGDPTGGGVYNSLRDRNGKKEFHQAWDVVPISQFGENSRVGTIRLVDQNDKGIDILSPISGKVKFTRPSSKYQRSEDNLSEGKFEIVGSGIYEGITIVLRYVRKGYLVEQENIFYKVVQGQRIGTAGSTQLVYRNPDMIDHIHIELYKQENGKTFKLDPQKETWKTSTLSNNVGRGL